MGAGPNVLLYYTAVAKRLQGAIGVACLPVLRARDTAQQRAEEWWVVFVGPYERYSNLLPRWQSLAEAPTGSLTSLRWGRLSMPTTPCWDPSRRAATSLARSPTPTPSHASCTSTAPSPLPIAAWDDPWH